jgi:hypothetical protein
MVHVIVFAGCTEASKDFGKGRQYLARQQQGLQAVARWRVVSDRSQASWLRSPAQTAADPCVDASNVSPHAVRNAELGHRTTCADCNPLSGILDKGNKCPNFPWMQSEVLTLARRRAAPECERGACRGRAGHAR